MGIIDLVEKAVDCFTYCLVIQFFDTVEIDFGEFEFVGTALSKNMLGCDGIKKISSQLEIFWGMSYLETIRD